MSNGIFKLERTVTKEYDQLSAVVVVAVDETDARDEASWTEPLRTTMRDWSDPGKTTCRRVGTATDDQETGPLVRDITWG